MRLFLASCGLALLAGCLFESDEPPPPGGPEPAQCATEPTYEIDTGASITHSAGIDPGYYAEYDGAGAWHFEWTCDTDLSAQGCIFSGSINAPGAVTATCYQCESNDVLTTTPNGSNTEIDFNTVTTTGIDGVDFTTAPGATIEINFQINNLDQNDLVFLPSGDNTSNPTCMPANLAPSSP